MMRRRASRGLNPLSLKDGCMYVCMCESMFLQVFTPFPGTLYLHIIHAGEMPYDQKTERERRMSYWGYSFERYCTEEKKGVTSSQPSSSSSSSSPSPFHASGSFLPVDPNAEFCTIVSTQLGQKRFGKLKTPPPLSLSLSVSVCVCLCLSVCLSLARSSRFDLS